MTVYMTSIPASRQVSLKPVQTGLVSSTLFHQYSMSGPCWETSTMLQRPAATQDFDIVLTREGGIKVSALHGFGEQYIAASGYRMLPCA